MEMMSVKDAQRGFFELLAKAESMPVILTRRGRPCAAVMSMARYRALTMVFDRARENAAAVAFLNAIAHAEAGRLDKADRALANGRMLAGGRRHCEPAPLRVNPDGDAAPGRAPEAGEKARHG